MVDSKGVKMVPMHVTSVRVTFEQYELCQKYKITFSAACRAGIGLLLAERGLKEYNSHLNIMRRMGVMREELEKKSRELHETEQKLLEIEEKVSKTGEK
jgi:hypothetical protein|tara:strand:+ start:7531 stop:7827 length:297 start_codon:yes stop_codon:yes gene_type:complete